MELALEDVKASLRGAGWEEEWGPPPAPHEFIVRREYLEKVVDADRACLKSRRPVVYLAASAGGRWYVVGPVPPTPYNCLPVTFKKAFPDVSSAVGELVEYAMKTFRFYPRWFKIGVIREAGLCSWPEFHFLCQYEDVAPPLSARTQKKTAEAPRAADGQAGGDGRDGQGAAGPAGFALRRAAGAQASAAPLLRRRLPSCLPEPSFQVCSPAPCLQRQPLRLGLGRLCT